MTKELDIFETVAKRLGKGYPEFDADQARAADGQWTEGGGGASSGSGGSSNKKPGETGWQRARRYAGNAAQVATGAAAVGIPLGLAAAFRGPQAMRAARQAAQGLRMRVMGPSAAVQAQAARRAQRRMDVGEARRQADAIIGGRFRASPSTKIPTRSEYGRLIRERLAPIRADRRQRLGY